MEEVQSNGILFSFIDRCRLLDHPRVLELGVKRIEGQKSTRRDHWVPNAGEYVGTDLQAGDDVNTPADVHRLTEVFGEETFDVVISCSTFEHFKYPHVAAHEVMKALKIGGLLFVQTHQAFPLHGFPHDYFRFSREALSGLFGTKMGFRVISAYYEFPAEISSPLAPNLNASAAYLNTCLYGEKFEKTPADYIFEFDS